MRRYLTSKSTQADQVDAIVADLESMGLLDDQAFASQLVTSYISKGKGITFIRQKLKFLGVEDTTISQALKNADQSKLIASAVKLLEKRASKLKQSNLFKTKAKAKNYLYQRGFTSPIISNAIDEWLAQE